MKRTLAGVSVALWFLLGGGVHADSAVAGELTPQERRGKAIYLRGVTSAGREITAFLGDPATEVPGSLMACGNCHGVDGRGNAEGGVTPSDLTPEALTKSYGVTHASGRNHPPYNTDSLLERAITKGIDPAGHRLHLAMPRYEMPAGDLTDLMAYMKRLGKDFDPGITEHTLTLGTLVPGAGALAESGRVAEAVLQAYFDDLNREGGIYSRKIEFRVGRFDGAGGNAAEQAARVVKEEQMFALVGARIAGSEDAIIPVIEDLEIPLVGPSSLYPYVGGPLNRHVFYLSSGLSEQARALVTFAAETFRLENPRIGIVYADWDHSRSAVEAIAEECRRKGWRPPARHSYPPGRLDAGQAASKLSDAGTQIVFFLGPGADAVTLASEGEKLHWSPRFLSSGSLAGREILEAPTGGAGKFYLSFPMLPPDRTSEGMMRFQAFAAKHKLGPGHLAAQISAYCAARILVEGLKLSGRELSREKLITALEGMYKFETGLMPPVTFGPNRRIGAMGASIVAVDPASKAMTPVGGWVEVR